MSLVSVPGVCTFYHSFWDQEVYIDKEYDIGRDKDAEQVLQAKSVTG